MNSVFIDSIKLWNKNNDRHTKLQHIYLVAAFVIVILAGLIGLLNFNFGQKLITLAAVLLGVFIFNAIAWALADSFIISHLTKRSTKR